MPVEYYEIDKESKLSDIILTIEEVSELSDYKLIDCSNNIKSVWILTWCKEYENGLINPYECVNVAIDSKDGSIMLYGRNDMKPNSIIPIISDEDAIKYSNSITSKYKYDNINVNLTFTRPNFYWETDSIYEMANFVRLCWNVSLDNSVNIQIDAETGEILGGEETKNDSGRSMCVVNDFVGQYERAMLGYNALERLGFNQTNYEPVYWSISQADIDWMLSRVDMYGLYLNCHGGVIDGKSVLADSTYLNKSNWQVWSDRNLGYWHFVYLDACETSSNNNFANAFNCTGAGECFVGWNNSVYTSTALDFDRRMFPRLGYMTVCDAVITSLWESRNAGYNVPGGNICDPGFIGDTNYYGWAW